MQILKTEEGEYNNSREKSRKQKKKEKYTSATKMRSGARRGDMFGDNKPDPDLGIAVLPCRALSSACTTSERYGFGRNERNSAPSCTPAGTVVL